MKNFSLHSVRFTFRILKIEDVSDRYISWLNDSDINKFLETRFQVQTRESCESFVLAMQEDPSHYLFGIFDNESGLHIGNIKLGFIDANHKKAQISFFIGDKTFWGRRCAIESIECVTKWGFETLRLTRIEAGCYEENFASIRAFLRVGYIVEGFQRSAFKFEEQNIGCFLLGMISSDPFRDGING